MDKIILHGSVARGEETEESDVDILVLATEKRSLKEHIGEGGFIQRRTEVPLLDSCWGL